MNKLIAIVILILSLSMVSGYIPIFQGTVTSGVLGVGPDCRKTSPNDYSSGYTSGAFSPFLGEVFNFTNLDASNANNAAVIAANGGNSNIDGASEYCSAGELDEFACGYAYPPPINPTDIFAVQWSVNDLATYFGASPGSSWTCVDSIGAWNTITRQPGFYAPPAPYPYTYTNANGPSLSVYYSSPGTLNAYSYPGPTSGGISQIRLLGPAPSQNIVAATSSCPAWPSYCFFSSPVACPSIHWVMALDYQGAASIISTAC